MLKQLRAAEKSVDTNPTPAQAEAGNYAHGHLRMLGFDVSIENPKDSIRRGTDKSGKAWEVKLKHSYGYIRGTTGADDDHLDCFIGDHPESELIFVIDQHIDGEFDEHKLVFGAVSEEDAREVYLSNYEKGWKGLKHITPLTKAQLRSWVDNGDQTKKLKGQKMDFHKRAGISAPVASNIEGVLNTASTVTDLTNKAAPVVRAVPGLTRTAPLAGSIGKLAAPAAMLSTAADLNAVARDSEGAAKDFNQNWNTSGVAGRALSVVGSPIRMLNAADYNNNNAARVAAANYTPPIQAPQPSFPKPTQTSAPAALVPKPTPMPIPKPAIKRAGMLPGLAMDAVGMVLLPQALHKEELPPAKGLSADDQAREDSHLISDHLTRYTHGGKGTWAAAKELMPSVASDIVDAVNRARAHFKKPELPEGEYRSYFTPKGDELYQKTLLPLHEQMLGEGIEKETAEPEAGDVPAYEDEHQKIYPVKQWSAKDQEDLEDASKSAAMKCPECGASAKFKKLGDAIKCSECEKTSDIDAWFTKKSTFWSLDNSPLSMQEAVKTAFADMRFTQTVKSASIAVDLDGTLAHHEEGAEFDPEHIGEPVPAMLSKVKAWLKEDKEVVIFTARAADPDNIPPIEAWLKKHGLEKCEISNEKTPEMEEFHDDRAVAIERNTGQEKSAKAATKFYKPENYESIECGKNWIISAGANDWENGWTWMDAECGEGDYAKRVWVQINYPADKFPDQDNSASPTSERGITEKEWGKQALKKWLAAARAQKAADEHASDSYAAWVRYFTEALEDPEVKPYVKAWGKERPEWVKCAGVKMADLKSVGKKKRIEEYEDECCPHCNYVFPEKGYPRVLNHDDHWDHAAPAIYQCYKCDGKFTDEELDDENFEKKHKNTAEWLKDGMRERRARRKQWKLDHPDWDKFEAGTEKNASLLQELKIAKEHSDRGDYKTKAGIFCYRGDQALTFAEAVEIVREEFDGTKSASASSFLSFMHSADASPDPRAA
jgi:hypothetical protein